MKNFGLVQALKAVSDGKSRPICFFFLRGGLGNQLFQIYSLRQLSITEGFDIVFCDFDVRKNPRDKSGALGLNLKYSEDYSQAEMMKSNRLINHILRIYRSQKTPYLRMSIVNIDQSKKLPAGRCFIANGFLQENLEFLSSDKFEIPSNLSEFIHFHNPQTKVAIHIRATDSLANSEMTLSKKYYETALNYLPVARDSEVDVYSDDTQFAKALCDGIIDYTFNYVEKNVGLNSLELLANLSNYEFIVCSKSTLAWWAAVFADRLHEGCMVVSPWNNHLHQKNWISVPTN